MGGHYKDHDWTTLRSTSAAYKAAPSAAAAWRASLVHGSLNPAVFKKVREVRNGPDCPKSTPIILGLDTTGSMGGVAHSIASDGLKTMITEIYDRKPVTDPQIAFAGIDDAYCYPNPLQISQFEGDSRLLDQLKELCITGAGGGNQSESYNAVWHFAATHVEADCWAEGRKGFLFTFGDESVPDMLTASHLQKIYGDGDHPVLTNKQLLAMLEDKFHVFHITVTDTPHGAGSFEIDAWRGLLGQRGMVVTDHTKLGEVIVSTIQILSGADKDAVVKSWSGDTSLVVSRAVGGLAVDTKGGGGLIRL